MPGEVSVSVDNCRGRDDFGNDHGRWEKGVTGELPRVLLLLLLL